MFIGHFGIGLGSKKAAPKVSLGTLFLAAQFLDLLWPTFLLLGWEQVTIKTGSKEMTPLNFTHYPWSHSLAMAIVWGLVVGLIYFLIKRNKSASIIVGLCVVSHWILDLVVHRPDLPLYPGHSTLVGLGLWNYSTAEVIVEGLIFIGGLILYLKATKPKNKTGVFAFWSLIAFLVIIHVSNIIGPPPTSTTAIAWAAESQWILVLWAYWADSRREPVNKGASEKVTREKAKVMQPS
jgi:membrane-bound metal-dependent hydrolase YbcI (DUF457 family)